MRRIYTQIPQEKSGNKSIILTILLDFFLSPIVIFIAWLSHLPGLSVRLNSYYLGFRILFSSDAEHKVELNEIYRLIYRSIDSVRYFEFGYILKEFIKNSPYEAYLDISSPRLLPISLLTRKVVRSAVLINPDKKDMLVTRKMINSLALDRRCNLYEHKIERLPFQAGSFDAITVVSVLEHIQDEHAAVLKIWELLRPDGVLMLSVPCSSEGFDEYIDIDEYGLGTQEENGFFFGQRFYDDNLLRDKLYSVFGKPVSQVIYGERKKGSFFDNRGKKMKLRMRYSYWLEPYFMSRDWKEYASLQDLPGVGVIILKFVKSKVIE